MVRSPRPMFGDLFEATASNAFRVTDVLEEDIVYLEISLKNLATAGSVNFPFSETSATAALNGGFVFRDAQFDDHPLREVAWEEWIQERVASGEERDEDDFV